MKRPATFTVQQETPNNLRAIAKSLGIIHTRGKGASTKEGSASGLLDFISYLVQAEGADVIARRLKGDE